MNDFPSSGIPIGPHGFWTRHPLLGNILRHFGHAAVVLVGYGLLVRSTPMLAILCLVLLLIWLAAWRLEIGSLWRSSVVSAFLLSAAGLLSTIK